MSQHTPNNPKEPGDKPPFTQKALDYPGLESNMEPLQDYGEESYKSSGKLIGRVALITGGDSGIGRAVALAYACEAADVVISYLNEEPDAQETVRVVKATDRRELAIPGDIADEAYCLEPIDRTVREFGRLDILVNNAAFQSSFTDIQDLPSADWERAFKVSIHAMFYLSRAALNQLAGGGSIITTTLIQSYQPSPELIHYASTKGAITTFTKALGQAGLKQSVRVNAVAPGPVWTPLTPASLPEEQAQTFGKGSELGRPAQPAELAPIYVFLALDDASYISGRVVGVTGGVPLT